jgi:drug/metabolite transporter (DMT)-like permease
MSLCLLVVAFVTTGLAAITNKAIHECGLDAYKDIYMLAFYAVGAAAAIVWWLIRPVKIRKADAWLGVVMGICGSLGLVFFIVAIAGMKGIVVFPVRNMGNVVLTALVSYITWREKLSLSQKAGIMLSLAAIFLLY